MPYLYSTFHTTSRAQSALHKQREQAKALTAIAIITCLHITARVVKYETAISCCLGVVRWFLGCHD